MEKTKTQAKIQTGKQNKENSVIDKIKDTNIKESLLLLISEKIININKINIKGEFEENLKKEIEEAIKEKYKEINENFSELRKSGKDLGVLNLKLMIIPLKIKVFLSTYEKKDAENFLRRIKEIENELISIRK